MVTVESRVYTRRGFETAIDLAAKLPLDHVVTHACRLQDVEAAFEHFRSGQEGITGAV